MENIETVILKLITPRSGDLFSRKRTKFATKKRQRKWNEIHFSLVDGGYISPQKHWTSSRSIWYRMVSSAKASLRKYTAGAQHYLHQQDIKVLDLLGIPIVSPNKNNNNNKENLVEEEESRVTMVEFSEDVSTFRKMTDIELKKVLLRQEFMLNEYKLLKMKYYFLQSNRKQIYEEFLKQLEP
nr:uncharacterized protein LOC106679469 [Halyomorpha halys]